MWLERLTGSVSIAPVLSALTTSPSPRFPARLINAWRGHCHSSAPSSRHPCHGRHRLYNANRRSFHLWRIARSRHLDSRLRCFVRALQRPRAASTVAHYYAESREPVSGAPDSYRATPAIMLRPATPLSILFFAAFCLLLLSTLSTPVIKAIPIATYRGVNFGVLGYCENGVCNGPSIGYDTGTLPRA